MAIANRLLEIPAVSRSNALRTFITAAWLGWQIESNWADPLLFAIYSIARRIAGVAILVVMYSIITNGALEQPIFPYIYLGNALYILVGQVMTGVSWAVIDDREPYRTMRQLHPPPMNQYFYLLGRGVAKLVIGLVSVLIVIGFGVIFFRLPLYYATIDWGLLLGSTLLGIISIASLGIILGGITLLTARHFWGLGEAIGGALYLFTGAIFPLDVLPGWLRPIGFAFPVTYWLELARRALLGPHALTNYQSLSAYPSEQLLGILGGFTVGLVILSVVGYHWLLERAKQLGLIDLESSY